MYLTPSQVDFFNNQGYLVIERFWTNDVVDELRSRIKHILDTLDLSDPSAGSVFTTNDQVRKSDDYFLNSGRNISFFWEERAFDEDGKLRNQPQESINKIGHGLHDFEAGFERVSYDERVGNICLDLGIVIPTIVQSMYIFKQAYVGGEVGAHQDGAFLYTEPQTCLGLWWALDDCHKENGCLWAVPGSHRLPVRRRFCRRSAADNPNEKQCGTVWKKSADAGSDLTFDPTKPEQWDLSTAVPLIIPRGSLVLLHHALVHYSEGNFSPTARHAYSIHIVDGKSSIVYPGDNWLQPTLDRPFRAFPAKATVARCEDETKGIA